jgi:hypothetical protein
MTNDLTKKLFCLDLDIMGMTGIQTLLILITLMQCGVDRYPQQMIKPRRLQEDYYEEDSRRELEYSGNGPKQLLRQQET